MELDSSRGLEPIRERANRLYRVPTTDKLMVNDFVIAMPLEPLATILAEGGYLPHGVPLIKCWHLGGQMVRKGLTITVDAIEVGDGLRVGSARSIITRLLLPR